MSSDEESSHQNREKFTAERSPSEAQAGSSQPPNDEPDFFGPALPPHLLGRKEPEKSNIYGPTLPNYLSKKEAEATSEQAPDEPKFSCDTSEKVFIGPQIPEHLKEHKSETEVVEENSTSYNDNDEEEDNFGPSPSLMATGDTTSYYTCIGRQKSNEQSTSEVKSKREEWMVELPAKKAVNFGLGPRQFRTRIETEREGDRSVWTDTPEDKERKKNEPEKKDHAEILKMKRLEERDKEMELLVKKAAKKLRKKESLMEAHKKKMKKKEKKEAKKQKKQEKSVPERRPFDRNVDLQVHRFDESQKRAILNKARFLNDRFASGCDNGWTSRI